MLTKLHMTIADHVICRYVGNKIEPLTRVLST
jgi:hypothetical protein